MSPPVRVLIVDDSATDAKLVARALGAPRSDLQIERVDDASGMRAKLAAGCDVVLCDWSMPGFGGFEALLIAKGVAPDVPFVIVSGTIGEEGAAAAIRGGAQDYVLKDNLTRLAGVVEREARNGRIRAALSEKRAEYERFFELTLDLLCIMSRSGSYKRLNPAWRALGFEVEQLVGRSWQEIVHPDDEVSTGLALVRAGNPGGEVVSFENRVRCGDGSCKHILWTAQSWGEEREVYAAGRDITHRKIAEDDLRRAHDDLEARVTERTTELRHANDDLREAMDAADRANRAKSTFVAHISHEIRTPMNAILGYSQLLARDTQLAADHRDSVETIQRAGGHLITLVNDVLAMAKIDAGQYRLVTGTIEVARFVDDLERMFRLLAASEGLSFTVEVSPFVPRHFLGDEGKLRQIVVNLVGNAIKFTKRGGVHARFDLGSPAIAEDGSAEPGRRLRVTIEDSGPGISSVELRDLFQPFAQADAGVRARGGSGLGLAISRDFARLMGGDITVETELGKGSVFTLEIPIHLTSNLPAPERGGHGAPSMRRSPSVATLPAELAREIHEAARTADYERLVELIERVPSAYAEGANELRACAARFAYDEILALASEPASSASRADAG